MDTYQAVFDAVRSKISFNGSELIERISHQFDISHAVEMVRNEFVTVAYEMQRPSVIHKPKISLDGNEYCALLGDNLQEGIAGFGESPAKAFTDFDKNFYKDFKSNEDKAIQ